MSFTDPANEAGAEVRQRISAPAQAAFHAFFEEHYARANAFAARLITDPGLSQDVVQDAFVEVLKRWADIEKPEAFFYTVVRRRAIDHYRRSGRESLLPVDQLPEPDVELDDYLDLRETVRSAIRELPGRQGHVFALHLMGLSLVEIGRELGISTATAGVHLHRARRALRRKLAASADIDW
ncbi:sigma-70 family RNA polymerase sigma factor [Streptomyces sp. KAU_LT]|uniref:RNA polymerase sigma factor n=1 Tax=Streptomyces sp. KAU_LT TaxID=3046669 RepID=UPI0024B66B4B|nr:sigma-70 family RNA polymerase sigma factor [Streptomyces sp. KAU_LT]MDI9836068.1 sigma-70 family RNA polymerase sigma factor [Streptomyces sp. KAU_LT]